MNELKLKEIVYALYILDARLIAVFGTHEDACRYGKKYYPNIHWHVEPYMVYELEK